MMTAETQRFVTRFSEEGDVVLYGLNVSVLYASSDAVAAVAAVAIA